MMSELITPEECFDNNQEEQNYLDMLQSILDKGVKKKDRTGVGTLSLFAQQLRFDLSKSFPLLTTKKIWLKGIFHELQWILSGSTNNKVLQEKKVHIWDLNSTREFLDSRNLSHYPEGDIGATTVSLVVISVIKIILVVWKIIEARDLTSWSMLLTKLRIIQRIGGILIDLWDPSMMDKVALMPCFMIYNFNVDTVNKKLKFARSY